VSFEKALTEELEKIVPDVFPLVAPEGTPTPYIVYKSSYGHRDYLLDGYMVNREIEVAVQVVGGSYSEMKQHTNAMIDSLLAFQGGRMGTDLVPVQSVQYLQPDEMVDTVTKENHSVTELTFRI
jgi:hypothetical protein